MRLIDIKVGDHVVGTVRAEGPIVKIVTKPDGSKCVWVKVGKDDRILFTLTEKVER